MVSATQLCSTVALCYENGIGTYVTTIDAGLFCPIALDYIELSLQK